MKVKEIYVKPEVETVEMEINVAIAGSLDLDETSDHNPSRIKRRSFWSNEEEL